MNSVSILILYIICVSATLGANILAVFPLASKSHNVMFEAIVKELAMRGHDIDVFSHFPLKNPIPGYNDYSLEGTQKIFVNNLTLQDVKFSSTYSLLEFMLVACGVNTCKPVFEADVIKDLKKSKKKYDLLLTEIFSTDCQLGWSHVFKIPIVGITSSVNLPWGSDRFGNPDNPSYIPLYFLEYTSSMNFFERVRNTMLYIQSKLMYYFYSYQESNRLAKEFFGPDMPELEELMFNTSLLLVNSHFSMNQPRPAVPGFVEIGGVHINKPKPLNEHFASQLKTETIYLSMGSMILTESFPPPKIQALFDALATLPYQILWKADKSRFPQSLTFPSNIKFEKWMPQMDILCHPNVTLFISHGGLMGSQEAVYCGVPRLGIPIFADQELNIRQSEKMGIALRVGFDELAKDKILDALNKLLKDPKYRKNAKKMSELFKDRPMKPLDTAVYWIEYVIRHKGAGHMQSAATRLNWYQYLLIDVAVFLLVVILIFAFILVQFLKYLSKLSLTKSKLKRS